MLSVPKDASAADIRAAYITLSRRLHPDVAPQSPSSRASDLDRHPSAVHTVETEYSFEQVKQAYALLTDVYLRKLYDANGWHAVRAVQSINKRRDEIDKNYAHIDAHQLDYLAETGLLVGGLLTSNHQTFGHDPDMPDSTHADACPRSVEEAIWNIDNADESTIYYTLWWIYRFKVRQAEEALVRCLQTSYHKTNLGGFKLRRRAALALGAVASQPHSSLGSTSVAALKHALKVEDYFLRYRAAEALANIAMRGGQFERGVFVDIWRMLKDGREEIVRTREAKSGYSSQEALFDLEHLDAEVREKLEKIFQQRRVNEQKSRRTTMTPQLGVDSVGNQGDAEQPFEWLLKAIAPVYVSCGGSSGSLKDVVSEDEFVGLLEFYTSHEVPLVKYAACKALYVVTQEEKWAQNIVEALEYGKEHHYSQRVLIRDLGDVGYCNGAKEVATCAMVENSFKILALKNMLKSRRYDAADEDVRKVLSHVDSLL